VEAKMPYGYRGKIARIDLSNGRVSFEQPDENFYRTYLGGRGLIAQYMLKELKPGIDPLSPDNKLIFANGVITGVPLGGCGRNSVGGKSPLTGVYGDAEAGGYFGAELKRAGYDALILEGRAERPVYIWIKDDAITIKDASNLWGKAIAASQEQIEREVGESTVRTAQIGPAGENMVRYACIINDLSHAAGRTGMGAVMGSKNVKAIAVKASKNVEVWDKEGIQNLALWLRDNYRTLVKRLVDEGSDWVLFPMNKAGGLPTRNFRQGSFEGAGNIDGRTMRDTIVKKHGGCWACPIRCKTVVATGAPYHVDPAYGGPEYETVASLGSNCGIDNLEAIAKGHELCNAFGLDTISTGASIAFAMECHEQGLLTKKDVDYIELKFGNHEAMLEMIKKIAYREGIGNVLAEGVARAAEKIGGKAGKFALHVKGQEVPMHEPRWKQGLGLGYAVSPTGADHVHNMHDIVYAAPGPGLEGAKSLGILQPLPVSNLSAAKVRLLIYVSHWQHTIDCLLFCDYVPFSYQQITDLVRFATGWNTTTWELMKAGERCINLTRIFNLREGLDSADDNLPERFFSPPTSGPLQGIPIDRKAFEEAKTTYYKMMNWDKNGIPTEGKLDELGIGWAAKAIKCEAPFFAEGKL
jgi:Aldehyde:ferredoxin oxidoreductase